MKITLNNSAARNLFKHELRCISYLNNNWNISETSNLTKNCCNQNCSCYHTSSKSIINNNNNNNYNNYNIYNRSNSLNYNQIKLFNSSQERDTSNENTNEKNEQNEQENEQISESDVENDQISELEAKV